MKLPQPYLLTQLLEQGALKHPEKKAFIFNDKSYTYKELDEKSNQLANYLISKGIVKGDRIGILLGRSIETAIAVYGIMKSGGVFVPLDPQAPEERLVHFISNCSITTLVSSSSLKRKLSKVTSLLSTKINSIGLVGDNSVSWDDVFKLSIDKPNIHILELDLAYIMYTSGSTGIPKGIMHTHRSGLSYAELSCSLYGVGGEDKIASIAPLHFDQSTFGYFTSLYAGATTVIASEGQLIMLESLSQLIEKEEISFLYTVPLLFTQLQEKQLIKEFRHLKWILFGGEVYPPKKFNQLIEELPHVNFSNVYGPAEVNQCTYKHINGKVEEDKTIPLGQVWNNTEVKVVDAENKETEGIGELLVRSSTMMMGYWKNDEMNQRAFFVDRNLAASPKYYRTGDLVKYNEDGELVFIGRKDRQVKIRGHRVELSEVENHLNLIESLTESAVFTIAGSDEKLLCAAVCVKENIELLEKDIRIHLTKFLPKNHIPTHFIYKKALPRTENGKVDYNNLVQSFNSK